MKFYFIAAFTRLLVFVGFAIAAAGQELREGERLARIHCAACHGFPEPNLLPERSWKHLLMHMGLRLGVEDLKALEGATEVERAKALSALSGLIQNTPGAAGEMAFLTVYCRPLSLLNTALQGL